MLDASVVLDRRQFLGRLTVGSLLPGLCAHPTHAQRVGTDYDVIVIGAGISGLVAARRLAASAHELKVLVLEARDRIGGRIFSTPLPEFYRDADCGALFLPVREDPEAPWTPVQELNLRTVKPAPGFETLTPGMSALADGIADGSVGTLQLNSLVKEVFWRQGLVGVSYRNQGLDSAVTARRLIVTLPPTVLRSGGLSFSPELPAAKRTAMDQVSAAPTLSYAVTLPASAAQLNSGDAEWMDEGAQHCLRAFRAGASGELLLEAQYRGDKAALLAGQPVALIRGFALRDFGAAITLSTGAVEPLWEQLVDWVGDELSRGARLELASVQARLDLAEAVSDTLFFAGDCTDVVAPRPDLAAAYASGERAAREVAQSLDLVIEAPDPNEPVIDLLL